MFTLTKLISFQEQCYKRESLWAFYEGQTGSVTFQSIKWQTQTRNHQLIQKRSNIKEQYQINFACDHNNQIRKQLKELMNPKWYNSQGKAQILIYKCSSILITPNKLILIMNLLVSKFVSRSWVSRTKTLLKRRKLAVKHRPISAKKLKQQSKLFNYAKEYRALQIQKQLDRRTYSSQHINELMDEIFYPDVTLAHEEAARIHMQTSALKQYKAEYLDQDLVDQSINQKILATDLIDFYHQENNSIQIKHFHTITKRLTHYFFKRQRIKQNIEKKWAKTSQNLKIKDKNYKQKKCPYLFLDRQDIYRYQPWNKMIEDFSQKVEQSSNNPTHFLSIAIEFSQILKQIQKGTNSIPYRMYKIFQKQVSEISQQQISQLSSDDSQRLIDVVNLKKSVRYPVHSVVPSVEEEIYKQFNKNVVKLSFKLLSTQPITSYHLASIIKCIKTGSILFTEELGKKIRPVILDNLTDLPFEKVVDLFQIYVKNTNGSDMQLLELLKFDILRKSPLAVSKYHLFKCIRFMSHKYIAIPHSYSNITDSTNINKMYAYDLLHHCSNVISSKYCGADLLTYQDVVTLVKAYFVNSVNDINLLQLIANEIVKIKDQLNLSQLTQSIFKIYLLGYRSPVLAKVLFGEMKTRYHQAKKRAHQADTPLLPGKEAEQKMYDIVSDEPKIPIQQLQLQEDLVISLWLLFSTREENNNTKAGRMPVSLDELMTIYPTRIFSKHPLIYELCLNLNRIINKQGVMWAIRCLPPTKRRSQSINNRLGLYYQNQTNNLLLKGMKVQAVESGQFVENYHIKQKKFLKEDWSLVDTFDFEEYLKFVTTGQQINTNFFNKEKPINQKIIQVRRQIKESESINPDPKNPKLEQQQKKVQSFKIYKLQ